MAIFPGNNNYNDQKSGEGEGRRSNGCGLGKELVGGSLGNYINNSGRDSLTFEVYTATDEFNRLHYLEEALTNMIYELADANPKNRVALVGFTRTIQTDENLMELTTSNVETLINKVRAINTGGGTRQDVGLKHTYEKYWGSGSSYSHNSTYTILVTDGAPVKATQVDNREVGHYTDAASSSDSASIYSHIKYQASQVRSKSVLMTVALGLESVEGGGKVLEEIASGQNYYCAMEDASQMVKNMQELLFKSFHSTGTIEIYGDVVDEITDSFYPIAWVNRDAGAATGRKVLVQDSTRDWVLLNENDWITLDGKYTTAGASDAAGQLLKAADGTFYIQWLNELFSNPNANLDMDRIAWVNAGSGSGTGRTVIDSYDGKDWILLNENDWITQEGEYQASEPGWLQKRNYGQVKLSGEDYYISWGYSASGANRQMYQVSPWKGTFYVKAKEDFIGGNAIETNKSAKVIVHGSDKYLDEPTVNVRLLDMNEMNSEITVYLGDLINGTDDHPLIALKEFYENTEIIKLIPDGGNVLNKVNADDSIGLKEETFTLRYAMGRDLTDDEWTSLLNGNSVIVDYTYDNPSSNGIVGFFIFKLEKAGIPGASPDYLVHEATAACQPNGVPSSADCIAPAETYTLHITYTAHKLGQGGRPSVNVHNGSGSPGTEVGNGVTLETGLGRVEKHNIHEVHVISGSIEITKKFDDGITDPADRSFSFILHRMEDGEDTSKDVTKTILIPANAQQGSASIVFDNLRRGTYTVTEAVDTDYMVKEIKVLDSTNCYSTPEIGASAAEVSFTMGNNVSNTNVIGTFLEEDRFTSYIDPINGVYGAAEFTNKVIAYEGEVPVKKVWDDGETAHLDDSIYVVLYKDGVPVLDSDGNAKLLKVDASTGWTGAFKVILADKYDQVSNYDYSIREVSKISDEELLNWQPAVLENDGTTVLYYEKALDTGDLVGVNGNGYMVVYATDADGTFIVENNKASALPATGGRGTTMYTFGGLLLIGTACLMYNYRGKEDRDK